MNRLSHLEIEITNNCNLACSICPHSRMKRPKGFMSWETLKKAMESIPKDGKKRTTFLHMIGEPLLHPELIEMINYVSKHNFFTSISTNAMLLDNRMAQKLLNSKVDEITLALDSLNEEVYNKIRVKGNLQRVRHNIDNFLSLWFTSDRSKKVELQVVINKLNESEVPTFENLYGWLNNEKNGKLRIKEYSTFAGKTKNMQPKEIAPRRFKCNKLNNSMAILWNGDVSICCRASEGECLIGNLQENTLEEIWNGEKLKFYRQALKNQEFDKIQLCKNC